MGKGELHGLARIIVGLMFALIGLSKLLNSQGFIGNLAFLGGAATVIGWIVLLAELVFGIAILVGWKVKLTTWPPLVIIVLGTILVIIPGLAVGGAGFNPGYLSSLFMHLLTIVILVGIMKMGPGAWSVGK
ncbi:MAG: DoxX family protein [Candidatus Nanoarchaeia archaeon]